MFRETETTQIIGKLTKIIPEGGSPDHPKWPMVEVQWFYKKQDLDFKRLEISSADREFIAYNEVFPSNHFDKVFVDCIVCLCQVYHID